MKLQTVASNAPVKSGLLLTREIYEQYGGMLLGYLAEVLRDRQLAENYLIEIFNDFPAQLDNDQTSEKSMWVRLQLMAKAKLAKFTASRNDCHQLEDELQNKWEKTGNKLAHLTTMQRTIFCGIYYHNKSVVTLATELEQPEETIKRTLKEAFNLIRNGR